MFISAIHAEAAQRREQLSAEHPEVDFLLSIAHTFNNFLPGFRGDLRRTYVVAPEESEMFPLERIEGDAMLGVPEVLFPAIMRLPIEGLRYIPGKAGIYIVVAMGPKESPIRAAIRIYQRPDRVRMLRQHNRISLVSINTKGEAHDLSPAGKITVRLWPTSKLDWEEWASIRR